MPELNKLIGARLAQCRKEKGWTLQYVAGQVKITLQRYHSWELGNRPVGIDYLHELAAFYDKNGGWISGFDEKPDAAKGPTITISDTLMDPELKKGDEVQIDNSITLPTTTDMFAIEVNGQTWVRWIRPELDGSYTIKAADVKQCPTLKADNLNELKKLKIIGRVYQIKRHV